MPLPRSTRFGRAGRLGVLEMVEAGWGGWVGGGGMRPNLQYRASGRRRLGLKLETPTPFCHIPDHLLIHAHCSTAAAPTLWPAHGHGYCCEAARDEYSDASLPHADFSLFS